MAIRFRTQDTRANTRRKLNEVFELTGDAQFRSPTPTLNEWYLKLNALVRTMVADGYEFDGEPPVFNASDTRQMWTRKLNRVAASYQAGIPTP
jgi:hypothetical protein